MFGYFSNWIHLLRLTLEICYLTLGAQMDFVTEAMLCKVCRPDNGKPTHDLRGLNGAVQRRLATLTVTILIL